MRLVVAACLAGVWLGACSGDDDAGGRKAECAAPLVRCGEACVDPAGNPDHCGACDLACGEGMACLDAVCVPLRCPPEQTSCGRGCADLARDPANCGGCGVSCEGDQACVDGACACPGSRELCDGTCVDTRSDPEHCGGCGEACDGADRCLNGACLPAACEGTLLLPGPPEFALGGPVRATSVVDWDGDGDLDLVAALVEPPEVWVFGNGGDGTFAPVDPVPGFACGEGLQAVDFDGDGDVDVVAVDPADPEQLVIARREDDGAYALESVPAGAAITAFRCVELNGTAPAELILATASEVRVVWGGPGGNSVATSADGVAYVRTGDFDGDGDADVAAVEASEVKLVLLEGTSGISWRSVPTGAGAGEPEVGDLDGDGDLDLAFSSGLLFRNQGDGTFASWPATLPHAAGLELADVNGDGRLDLLFVGPAVDVRLNTADGFVAAGARPLGPHTTLAAVGAFDGDATADLLAVQTVAGRAALLPGRGDGAFPGPLRTALHTGEGPRFAVANVVAGGAADLLLGFRSEPEVHVYRATLWGLVYAASVDVGHGVEDLALGDVDGDGYRDLFAVDRAAAEVTLSRSDPDGDFAAPMRIPVGGGPSRLALVDVDEDGWRDLAVLETDAPRLRVLRNNLWTDPMVADLAVSPLELASGDTDGDGVPEFVVAGIEGLQVVRRDRGGLVAGAAFEPAATTVELGDLDGDGRAETLALGAAALTVYRGGDSLEPIGTYAVDGGVALGLADLDVDGQRDALVLLSDGRVQLFRGEGAGRLAPAGWWGALRAGVGAGADLAFLDGDRDGRPEPVVGAGDEQVYLIPGCRP